MLKVNYQCIFLLPVFSFFGHIRLIHMSWPTKPSHFLHFNQSIANSYDDFNHLPNAAYFVNLFCFSVKSYSSLARVYFCISAVKGHWLCMTFAIYLNAPWTLKQTNLLTVKEKSYLKSHRNCIIVSDFTNTDLGSSQ